MDPRGNVARQAACTAVTEIPRLEDTGEVPHYLPGENDEVGYMTSYYHLPAEAVLGYAETTYPEYRKKLKNVYTLPAACDRYCCGWIAISSGSVFPAPGLTCVAGGKGTLPGRSADTDRRTR